jgi:hypothetical protein
MMFESNSFITLLTAPWFFAVVGGFIVLGIFMAYGALRTAKRTRSEKLLRDAATRKIYHDDATGKRV